jgi:hypothetical protein
MRRRSERAGDAVYLVSVIPLAGELQGWDHYVVRADACGSMCRYWKAIRVVPESTIVNPCSRVTCGTLCTLQNMLLMKIMKVMDRFREVLADELTAFGFFVLFALTIPRPKLEK